MRPSRVILRRNRVKPAYAAWYTSTCKVYDARVSQPLKTNTESPGGGRGATPRVLGRQLPLPPPRGASGQQLVAKGAALRSPWAPKAPDTPWPPKPPKGKFCPLCTPTLSLNPTLTLTPTPTLSLVLTLPLPLPLPLPPTPSPKPSPGLNPNQD